MTHLLTLGFIVLQLSWAHSKVPTASGATHTPKFRGWARITNTQAISNSVRVKIDDKIYTLGYNATLTVYTNDQSPTGNYRKTVWLESHGDGVFSRERFVFEGMTYSLAFNRNGDYELYQGL